MVILTFQTVFMARHGGRKGRHYISLLHIISWVVISMYVNSWLLVISWDYLYLLGTPHHLRWFARGFFFLWAWQPAAARPTGNKTRAAGGGEESGQALE